MSALPRHESGQRCCRRKCRPRLATDETVILLVAITIGALLRRKGGWWAGGVQQNDSLVDGYYTLLLVKAVSTNETALLNAKANAASRSCGLASVHAKSGKAKVACRWLCVAYILLDQSSLDL